MKSKIVALNTISPECTMQGVWSKSTDIPHNSLATSRPSQDKIQAPGSRSFSASRKPENHILHRNLISNRCASKAHHLFQKWDAYSYTLAYLSVVITCYRPQIMWLDIVGVQELCWMNVKSRQACSLIYAFNCSRIISYCACYFFSMALYWISFRGLYARIDPRQEFMYALHVDSLKLQYEGWSNLSIKRHHACMTCGIIEVVSDSKHKEGKCKVLIDNNCLENKLASLLLFCLRYISTRNTYLSWPHQQLTLQSRLRSFPQLKTPRSRSNGRSLFLNLPVSAW